MHTAQKFEALRSDEGSQIQICVQIRRELYAIRDKRVGDNEGIEDIICNKLDAKLIEMETEIATWKAHTESTKALEAKFVA